MNYYSACDKEIHSISDALNLYFSLYASFVVYRCHIGMHKIFLQKNPRKFIIKLPGWFAIFCVENIFIALASKTFLADVEIWVESSAHLSLTLNVDFLILYMFLIFLNTWLHYEDDLLVKRYFAIEHLTLFFLATCLIFKKVVKPTHCMRKQKCC